MQIASSCTLQHRPCCDLDVASSNSPIATCGWPFDTAPCHNRIVALPSTTDRHGRSLLRQCTATGGQLPDNRLQLAVTPLTPRSLHHIAAPYINDPHDTMIGIVITTSPRTQRGPSFDIDLHGPSVALRDISADQPLGIMTEIQGEFPTHHLLRFSHLRQLRHPMTP